jgi:hypothetical protein
LAVIDASWEDGLPGKAQIITLKRQPKAGIAEKKSLLYNAPAVSGPFWF